MFNKKDIKKIQQITWIGVLINITLSILKFILGYYGRSQAVMADAIHSLSDLSTDFAIIFGVKVWSKPADDDHPYGHRRIEAIVSVGISMVLVLIALGIGYKAVINIRYGVQHTPEWIALWGAILSILLKEALYHWTISVGEQVKSSALKANAIHHRTDAISSIPIAIAVAIASCFPQWAFLDYLGAIIVSIFILHAAWYIMFPAFSEMVDTGASEKYRHDIESIIVETPGVLSFHALRTRRMGSGWYIDLHVQVDENLSVHQGHQISQEVKENLLEKGEEVLDVLVHLEPYEKQ